MGFNSAFKGLTF